MSFSELGLLQPIVRAVEAAGYSTPTPIQAQAIPVVITGRDLLGVAQTGTGKTAAFALPIIHRLLDRSPVASRPESQTASDAISPESSRSRHLQSKRAGGPADPSASEHAAVSAKARKIRVLVLSPTRELAVQIGESMATYSAGTPLRHTVVFGGVSQYHQVKALRHGVDILVATPGRLMDLREQGFVDLSHVQVLVLDEADRMLDMGFLPTVRRIVQMLPIERQTLLFSATMPPEIRDLADSILRDPASIEIAPVATTADNIEQSVYFVEKGDKLRLLRHVLKRPDVTRTLVFTKTKHGADKLARQLNHSGFRVEAIHGNRTQSQRQRALHSFKCGRTSVLIATDLASRGIDVDGVSHVINYDLPMEADNYVHRIGRTARAGASGIAISFCSGEERSRLKAIERLIRQRLDVCQDHPAGAAEPEAEQRLEPRRHPVAEQIEPFGIMDDDVLVAPQVSADIPIRSGSPARTFRTNDRKRRSVRNKTASTDFGAHQKPSHGPRRFAKSGNQKSRRPARSWS